MDNKISKLKEIIDNSDNIVFFGGAGCSCESGIPDFRSANGIFMDKNKKWVTIQDTTPKAPPLTIPTPAFPSPEAIRLAHLFPYGSHFLDPTMATLVSSALSKSPL